MSLQSFADSSYILFLVSYYSAYALTASLALGGLVFLFVTGRFRNRLLIILNLVIFVDCATFVLF